MSAAHNKANQRQNRKHKGYYEMVQPARTARNKKRKMLRTMKQQPNNRDLALRMREMFGTEFEPSPLHNPGPYTITKLGIASAPL